MLQNSGRSAHGAKVMTTECWYLRASQDAQTTHVTFLMQGRRRVLPRRLPQPLKCT
jgi:hypothetical protein